MQIVLGLTGGPGCGKSAAAECLADAGLRIIDTDVLARIAVSPGRPAADAIRREFGAEFFNDAGELRRDLLARVVFSDSAARQRLNDIVHPEVRAMWTLEAYQCRSAGKPCAVVIPLLFESALEKEFTTTVCVGCSASVQTERLAARGWDDAMIRKRIESQLPLDQKCLRATHVIWNDGSLEILRDQVNALVGMLQDQGANRPA